MVRISAVASEATIEEDGSEERRTTTTHLPNSSTSLSNLSNSTTSLATGHENSASHNNRRRSSIYQLDHTTSTNQIITEDTKNGSVNIEEKGATTTGTTTGTTLMSNNDNDDDDIEVSLMSNQSVGVPSHHNYSSYSRTSSIGGAGVTPLTLIHKNSKMMNSNSNNSSNNGLSTSLTTSTSNMQPTSSYSSVETNRGSISSTITTSSTDVTQVLNSVKKPIPPHLKDQLASLSDHRQSFYIYHYDYRPSTTDDSPGGDLKAITTSIRNIKKKNRIDSPVNETAFKSFFVKSQQQQSVVDGKKKTTQPTSQNTNKQHATENESNAETESKKSLHVSRKNEFPCLISLKLTFAFLISVLIVFACVGIFISVFVPLYVSIDELTYKNVQTIHKQISVHLDKILGTLKSTSLLVADTYNRGFMTKPMFREYLFDAYRRTGVFAGYFFSKPPISERFSYTIMSPGNRLYYTRQENGFPGIIRDRVDFNGTVIQYNATVDSTPAILTKTDFYVNTLTNIAKLKSEGVFSSPFYIINGSIALPYATLLYDPLELKVNGTKVIQGICRATIPLILFSDFLKDIKVLEKGYTILTELNGPTTIAGSIKTTSADGKKALSVFELTDNNAGELMKAIASAHNDFYNLPSFFSVSSRGNTYLISVSNYTNENIAWRQFVIVDADDITKTTQNGIIAAICVTFGVLVFSVFYGNLISRIAIRPILYLKKQLASIQVFDLKNVKRNNSIYSEINSIYDSLEATVKCLSEIKSFLPDTVVNQLDEIEQSTIHNIPSRNNSMIVDNNATGGSSLAAVVQDKISLDNKSTSAHSNTLDTKSNTSFRRASPRGMRRQSSAANETSLFRMGLSRKECSVLNISLPHYTDIHTPEEISTTFPKIVAVIRSAAQQFQANLQVVSLSEFILVFDQSGKRHKHIAVTAMECALKVKRGLQALNTQQDMSSEKVESFNFSLGVSTSENCHVGNLGTRAFRYYSIISESTVIAKNLSFLANQLKINILVDETTFKESNKYFITRPVERLLFRSIKKQILDNDVEYLKSQLTTIDTVSSVYELIRESAIEENEWMYELQNQNENLRISKYHNIFDIFKPEISNETFLNLLSEKIVELKDYLLTDPNDYPSKNLLELYEKFESNKTTNIQAFRNTISTYCISVDKSITTHLLLTKR